MAKFKVRDNVECDNILGKSVADYGVEYDGKDEYAFDEWQLEPIIDLGSWDVIERAIGWNPTKEMEKLK